MEIGKGGNEGDIQPPVRLRVFWWLINEGFKQNLKKKIF